MQIKKQTIRKAMRIWLDCTSLMNWQNRHLTGIQRTVLGFHKGWRECGVDVYLYRFDEERQVYVTVLPRELPDVVRKNIENQHWSVDEDNSINSDDSFPQPQEATSPDLPSKISRFPAALKRQARNAILGTGEGSQELRLALREMGKATWRLRKALVKWGRERHPDPPEPGKTEKSTKVIVNTDSPNRLLNVGDGDYMFTIGTECFGISGNLRASHTLRSDGAILIRMVYDMIPALQPQWVDELIASAFSEAANQILQCSDHILTISEYSRKDILHFATIAGIQPPPITPVRLGDSLHFSQKLNPQPHNSNNTINRPFFLCLGTLEPRKNHRLLYDVWRRLAQIDAESCPNLVCIGGRNPMCDQLIYEMTHDPLVKERIKLLHGIEDQEMARYYDECTATIFPSLYEGWGLPVAESLANCKLCLASKLTSIPEISEELPIFFDPFNRDELLELIQKCLNDPKWRKSQEQIIAHEYVPTTWRTTASQALNAIGILA